MPAFGAQLSDFKWKNRPLLIFAPDQQDPSLQKIRLALEQRSCDLDDRDMVIGIYLTQGRSSFDGHGISARDASTIRRRFGIHYDAFAVLLIGKDGSEKLRSYEIPELNSVFALIDQMPMRRNEMSGSRGCSGESG